MSLCMCLWANIMLPPVIIKQRDTGLFLLPPKKRIQKACPKVVPPKQRRRRNQNNKNKNNTNKMSAAVVEADNNKEGVYVLQEHADDPKVYVGKSSNIPVRIQEHMAGHGTTSCVFSPASHRLAPLTPPVYAGKLPDWESWERVETLTRMYEFGIDRVRGWMFTAPVLSHADKETAFLQICERFDLCRRCGRATHFVQQCKAKTRVQWGQRLAI